MSHNETYQKKSILLYNPKNVFVKYSLDKSSLRERVKVSGFSCVLKWTSVKTKISEFNRQILTEAFLRRHTQVN